MDPEAIKAVPSYIGNILLTTCTRSQVGSWRDTCKATLTPASQVNDEKGKAQEKRSRTRRNTAGKT
jgi:hypothetical protein